MSRQILPLRSAGHEGGFSQEKNAQKNINDLLTVKPILTLSGEILNSAPRIRKTAILVPGIHGSIENLPGTTWEKNLMSTIQRELVSFSRILALLFNRATTYNSSHPYVTQTIDAFHLAIEPILKSISPLVFIMNRDQFFLDEDPLPAGTSVNRIVAYFNKTGIQSISFENGLDKNQIRKFLEVFTSLDAYPDADAMKRALVVRGVRHVKINHVFFKKITENDEIISQEALKGLTLKTPDADDKQARKLFMDMVLGQMLAEDLKETITLENLLKDPSALSRKMTETDLATVDKSGLENCRPGLVITHQLELLGEDLEKNLIEDKRADLPEIATALFEMKKRLAQSMKSQRSLNINYPNEEMILGKADEITDTVVLRIVEDEYKAGKTSPASLAQMVILLIPDSEELKRLLPKIRSVLTEDGMTLSDFLQLVRELGKELQSAELAGLHPQEISEGTGIDGNVLMEEIGKDPVEAAELIALAAQIQEVSGDEQAISNLLADYAERLGSELRSEIGKDGSAGDEEHLRKTLTSFEFDIFERLKGMNLKDDLLERLEDRFNDRVDGILEQVKRDWISSHSGKAKESQQEVSVLELLEKTVSEGEDLHEILDIIRGKVRANEIDQDNFAQIYAEITKQQANRALEATKTMPKGVLDAPALTQVIEKELARANRYKQPFSALAFAIVKAVPKSTGPSNKISYQKCAAAVFQAISKVARDADIIGELGRNNIVILLPMTSGKSAQVALKRYLKALHAKTVKVNERLLEIRLAGVASVYDYIRTPDAASFIQVLSNELAQMERRIRNLQTYF